MRILLVNNHHRYLGGTERYYLELGKLLKRKGHQVAYFSQHHPDNLPSRFKKYFVSSLDFSKNDPKSFLKKVSRMFYSLEAKRKMLKLLDHFKPDVVHLNNIYYYLSPSILSPVRSRGIPAVMTIHDYQLISPSITFFHDGKICEITKPRHYYRAIWHRCVKGSLVASLMAVIVSYLSHLFKFYQKSVGAFIVPSLFMKKKLLEYHFSGRPIHHLPNFILPTKTKSNNKHRYVLYSGRIDDAKGVNFLLRVAKSLPQIKFCLAGRGELKQTLPENIKFLGFQKPLALQKLIAASLLVIIPSLWYENQPYAVLEAYALGKPVLASRIGGLPEIVVDGKTGVLFNPGNLEDCRLKLFSLWKNPAQVRRMGQAAEKYAQGKFSAEKYYQQLMKIYSQAGK